MGIVQKYRRTLDKKHPHPQKENTMSQNKRDVGFKGKIIKKQKAVKGRQQTPEKNWKRKISITEMKAFFHSFIC